MIPEKWIVKVRRYLKERKQTRLQAELDQLNKDADMIEKRLRLEQGNKNGRINR